MNFNSKLLTAAKLPQHHSSEWNGLSLVIEWPKNSVRTGTDGQGKPWKRTMSWDYGYIKGVNGHDKEPQDVYLGPNKDSDRVFVVEQLKPDGKTTDEFKVMLGFDTLEEAKDAYLIHYPEDKNWEETRLGEIAEMPFEELLGMVEEHQEEKTASSKPPAVENYVWVSPGRNDDRILEGNISDHWKFQDSISTNGHPITTNFDSMPRGYAEVRNDSKTVILSLSPLIKPESSSIPESLVREFKQLFPRYEIYKNGAKTAGLAYPKALQSMTS